MKRWHIKFKTTGEERENITTEDLVSLLIRREILEDDYIWDERNSKWKEIGEIEDFKPFFRERYPEGRKKILIIEDEDNLRSFLVEHFHSIGYAVVEARDGLSGFEKVRKEKPDLVILDIRLPKMSGWEVCKKVKMDKNYKNIPILMLTSENEPVSELLGLSLGAVEYITKPFSLEELTKKIDKLVNSK
ncbi:MAG: hypothetical protein DRI36_00130 [Caldiserica bacterium]|nr:MAG: hypothetical protein DRI36_00130 [Caldisericota bacterium]